MPFLIISVKRPGRIIVFFSVLLNLSYYSSAAQGRLEDYRRSEILKNSLKDKIYYAPATVNWSKSNQWVWYSVQTARGKEFRAVNPTTKTRRPAFDHEQLAQKLSEATQKKITPYALPFSTFTYGKDDLNIEFSAEGFVWTYTLASNSLVKKEPVRPQEQRYWGSGANDQNDRPVFSPDSTRTAFVKNYNLYVRVEKTKKETQLSFDGSEGDYYSGYVHWSPDSKKLISFKVRPGQKHLIYFVRSSPEDQLQPKLESRDYLKPGDALPVRRPQLFLVEEQKQLPVDDALFNQQYGLSRPEWRKDSRAFTFEYNQRGHQVYRVLEINAANGAVRALVEEQSKTFIDYSGKRYRSDVADGKEIIWASERDGWNHLYLYDGLTGKVKKQITKGEWPVRNVLNVNEEKRTVTFAASGMNPQQDPYFVQYYRINFDGTGLTALTSENANHTAYFSPDNQYFVDTYSRVDMPQITVLRSATDGSVVMELEKADISEWLKAGWKAPEVFTAKGRDGKTDIWGIIVRPTNFDPAKKYPVIENIYAGPHSSFTPKTFMTYNRSMFELAELGFIVVQLDGMGTSNRSKAFHDVCWQNLKDAGFPDRILWMQEAAKKYPSLDLSRVGIYGTSAGGQSSTGGLLFYPDFYKVAVSSCGCHDNRMDKIWWNEQWMGYPIGPHYADCSNVTHADKLQGKLLLMVGEVDDNVDPASTMQLVNALIKSNKDFDFLMVPNMAHSTGGEYGERKRRDFFVRHLLGIEPPAWTLPLTESGGGK
ncbi:S9 family peptidase [Runella slithyformis]|uniref:Peptidase s9b dipeptidylpeptidase IV domain protein n=1 Tax=Runella slithyformis (strain ATCC 29530 / DSM 19594 / LMG 11500 / NCIMB 11436 / LSU 4) TaxID=761193 RepID=A0A7U3ZQ99_RUNSL|nr:S9 family peptidase [Runella slithyformis]AEI51346.1 peptidase s9b dipeptidylpeptidase IV domain protein [Runella slithyformis DSM 19594]